MTSGYRRWVVEPRPGGLGFAQGEAPSSNGPIVSRWVPVAGDSSFVLTAGGPRLTLGAVCVPLLGRARSIAMDGRLVWNGRRVVGGQRARRRGDEVCFSGVRGVHTFAWTAAPR